MKLIGITGRSGAGKTTLSRMIEEKDKDISVIHIDEISHMNELKKRLPGKLVDEDTNTNEIGESFLTLSKPVRDIKSIFLKSKVINTIYRNMKKVIREIDVNKRISSARKENKKAVVIEGTMLTRYSVYKDIDYIVHVDAPFIQREERVIKRKDKTLEKNNMVMRDLHFREAMQVGKKKGRSIDEKVENTGLLEELQKIADRIYSEQIIGEKQKDDETMQDKYGGYKIITPKVKMKTKSERNEKGDISK